MHVCLFIGTHAELHAGLPVGLLRYLMACCILASHLTCQCCVLTYLPTRHLPASLQCNPSRP